MTKDEREREWTQEAEGLRKLDRAGQREMIADYRSHTDPKYYAPEMIQFQLERADFLEKILGLVPRKSRKAKRRNP